MNQITRLGGICNPVPKSQEFSIPFNQSQTNKSSYLCPVKNKQNKPLFVSSQTMNELIVCEDTNDG